jgi:hypothetical protein
MVATPGGHKAPFDAKWRYKCRCAAHSAQLYTTSARQHAPCCFAVFCCLQFRRPHAQTHLFILEAHDLAQRREELVPPPMGAEEAGVPLAVVQDNVVPDVQLVGVCVLQRCKS